MIKLTSPSQFSSCSSIPAPYRQPVITALNNLFSILGSDPSGRGFVLFVEENDTLADINNKKHGVIKTWGHKNMGSSLPLTVVVFPATFTPCQDHYA